MEAYVLAGGKGTRLREAVSDRPKPMAEINGRPFLHHLLKYFISQGVDHFILSTGYKRTMIRDYFGTLFGGIPITYAEEEKPLGTGGAILRASRFIKSDNPFLVLNGDTFFRVRLSKLRQFHAKTGCKITIALMHAFERGRFGRVECDEKHHVKSLGNGKADIGMVANGGVYILDPDVFKGLKLPQPSFSFEDLVLPSLLEDGIEIGGITFSSEFIDIGLPQDYHKLSVLYGEYFGKN
ncbi:MAG: sugar phosphate nucleotidyltransferase [Pseudomonadota bacterium]|nr:sugar phosphate nucleotidyltransferase [Pseudomonadota bacterium]